MCSRTCPGHVLYAPFRNEKPGRRTLGGVQAGDDRAEGEVGADEQRGGREDGVASVGGRENGRPQPQQQQVPRRGPHAPCHETAAQLMDDNWKKIYIINNVINIE